MTEIGIRTLLSAKTRPVSREGGFLHRRCDPAAALLAALTLRLEREHVRQQHPAMSTARKPLRGDLALVEQPGSAVASANSTTAPAI